MPRARTTRKPRPMSEEHHGHDSGHDALLLRNLPILARSMTFSTMVERKALVNLKDLSLALPSPLSSEGPGSPHRAREETATSAPST